MSNYIDELEETLRDKIKENLPPEFESALDDYTNVIRFQVMQENYLQRVEETRRSLEGMKQ